MKNINEIRQHNVSLLQRYPKTVLFGLLIVCVIPFLLAHLLYMLGWHPVNSVNQGTLLEEPISLSSLKWQAIKSTPIEDKWLLIVTSTKNCDSFCEKNIEALKQVQAVLGKNSYRIARVLILIDSQMRTSPKFNDQNSRLGIYETQEHVLKSGVAYICDPKGNIIFEYDTPIHQEAIFKDMKRLLEYSHIG